MASLRGRFRGDKSLLILDERMGLTTPSGTNQNPLFILK